MNILFLLTAILLVVLPQIQSNPPRRHSNRPASLSGGLFKLLFSPYPKPLANSYRQRPGYGHHNYYTTSPKPDFENDKYPDYDLYLLGRKRRRRFDGS